METAPYVSMFPVGSGFHPRPKQTCLFLELTTVHLEDEMAYSRRAAKLYIIPVLPLRGLTVFPYMELYFDVGRALSVKALEAAMTADQKIFLVTQKDARIDDPGPDGLYPVGTIAKVKQLVRISADTIRVRVEGGVRGELVRYVSEDPYLKAEVCERQDTRSVKNRMQLEALQRQALGVFEEYAKLNGKFTPDTVMNIASIEEPGQLTDVIAASVFLKTEQKQELLELYSPAARLESIIRILLHEIEILTIERDIGAKVRKQIEKSQREYYLREQVKVIQNELGDREGILAEVDEYREKLEAAKLPEEVAAKAFKELDRMSKMQAGFAETTVVRTYLDWILDIPWTYKTEESRDIKAAERILEEDHYGLEKVKERILEYLSIRMYKNSLKGPIICLIGPPGVGKTSVAKSIARALNRKYVRMSLGGVRDEAEIRGHRRTYIGALPGRIITALKQAGSANPLILLDEIDKMSSDYRGDPASAMLEVLDSEQNFAFRDHYVELAYDLSDVMFMTTANNADQIPKPLYDRMEIIQISGYTEEEKLRIALDFLVPKQLEAHGATKREIRFEEKGVRDVINYYTKESGVRTLEREIASLCRKSVRILTGGEKRVVRLTQAAVGQMLGVRKYRYEKAAKSGEVGVARGLAWTAFGGDTLSVEVNVMKGTGKLELTGQLGSVMKESAKAAMSYVRSRATELGIDEGFHGKNDVHVHVPEGAIPKDGPSAGITLACALASALTGAPVRSNVAMTGEVTLRGRVLPIGGLKEKTLAAHRAGIDTVIMPDENVRDIDDIPQNVRDEIRFVPVKSMDEVLAAALEYMPKRASAAAKRKTADAASDKRGKSLGDIGLDRIGDMDIDMDMDIDRIDEIPVVEDTPIKLV